MRLLLKNKKGFTLVELLIALILIGVLITAVYQIFQTTGAYNNAIDAQNVQRSITENVMYNLRVELADAAEAEAFDPGVNPEKIDFSLPDNDEYYYIVQNTQDADSDGHSDGGYLLYGFDSAGNRVTTPTVYGNTSTGQTKYAVQVNFTTNLNGQSEITVSAKSVDAAPTDGAAYELYSKVELRSVAQNGVTMPAIRYKKIK